MDFFELGESEVVGRDGGDGSRGEVADDSFLQKVGGRQCGSLEERWERREAYNAVVSLDELDRPHNLEQLHHSWRFFRRASLRGREEVVEVGSGRFSFDDTAEWERGKKEEKEKSETSGRAWRAK